MSSVPPCCLSHAGPFDEILDNRDGGVHRDSRFLDVIRDSDNEFDTMRCLTCLIALSALLLPFQPCVGERLTPEMLWDLARIGDAVA